MAQFNPCPPCKEIEELIAALQESIKSLQHEIDLASDSNDCEAVEKYQQAVFDTEEECQRLMKDLESYREKVF